MADSHPLEDIVTRPGVYFNPQTEVLIVVDDSAEMDGEIFNMEEFEGSDWVQISEEIAVDEVRRDELLVSFQTHYHPGDARSVSLTGAELEEEGDDEEDDQEVGARSSGSCCHHGLREPERQRQNQVNREQLHSLEPVRLALRASPGWRSGSRGSPRPARSR